MSYQVFYSTAAELDLLRLYDFILERSDGDFALAERALDAIRSGVRLLEHSPFSCRKATPSDPLLRELLIPFGSAGYLALYRITDAQTVTLIAVRHQREDDYH